MLNDLSITSQGLLLLLAGILVLVFAIIVVGRRYYASKAVSGLTEKYKAGNAALRARNKYPEVDVFGKSDLFLRLGLILTLALVIGAFNWTQFEKKVIIPEDALTLSEDIEVEIPRSDVPPPPPPPPPPPVIEAVPDKLILEAEEDFEFQDQSIEATTAIDAPKHIEGAMKKEAPPPPPPPPPAEPDIKEIFKVVEEMPRFPGCEDLASVQEKKACADKKLLEFIYANIRYPQIARENGIEGTVVVQFVVNTDGTVTDAALVRDIGAKCGEEAMRIVAMMNEMPARWAPGKQRGRPVRVMFTLPVKFKLEYQ